jgi:hypothetical protein
LEGGVRSISTFGTTNGRTFPTQGAGSSWKSGGVGRQVPGVVPTGGVNGGLGLRPSFARAASIAAAVASPAAMPPAFAPGQVPPCAPAVDERYIGGRSRRGV